MSLKYILNEVCEKCGYDPVDQRNLVVNLINRAAKEIYEMGDLPGSLREVTVLAPADNIIALPWFVGQLRNMRTKWSKEKIVLRDMYSRYDYNAWTEDWDNWRILRKSPIKNCIQDATVPIILTMGEVDTVEVNVTIVGSTITSSRVSEVVTFSVGETQINCSKLFTDIFSISKDVVNNQDITVTGVDSLGAALELAVIPNNITKSNYTLVDVSRLPQGGDYGTAFRYVEILFRVVLPLMVVDGDEFICDGFDDALVYKVCEYYFSEKANGGATALGWMQKCKIILDNAFNPDVERTLKFGPHPLLNLYPRYLYPRSRQNNTIIR